MDASDIMQFFGLLKSLDGQNPSYILFAAFFFLAGKAKFKWILNVLLFIVSTGFLISWVIKGTRWSARNGVWAGGLFLKAIGFYVEEPAPRTTYLVVTAQQLPPRA